MSRLKTVSLPELDRMHLIIKTKQEIRAHPAYTQIDSESNECWYWNRVWCSEVALAEWLIHEFYPDKLLGKTVLELGCGTGLAGLVAAKLGGRTTFSDKIPMVLDTLQETCAINGIVEYQTLLLDWSRPGTLPERYHMVLGSEIFYDVCFLGDLHGLLKAALADEGRGVFCDPNRLGFDVLEDWLSPQFQMHVEPRMVDWPQKCAGQGLRKRVFLYDVMKKYQEFSDRKA